MKRSLLLISGLVVCLQVLQAQSKFQRAIGTSSDERNYHLATTHGGSFIATGYMDGISGNGDDAFLVKYNNLGGVEWSQTYGSTGNDYSWDVINTANSDIVGVGYTTSFGTPKNAATITRTDSNGTVIWLTGVYHLSYGVEFYRVIETKTGHLLATGLVQSANDKDQMVLSKFTSKGQLIWTKTIGSSATDEAMGLLETASGHYLLAGLSEDANGNGGSDFAVVKTDTAGRVIWSKLYGGSKNERLNTVVESRRWFYFVGWSSSIGNGESDAVVLRTDTAGKIITVNAYGSTRNDLAFNAVVDDNNHLMVAGYTDAFSSAGQSDNRNSFLLRINIFNGNMGWSQTYGGSKRDGHWPTGLAQSYRDPGFYLLGSTQSYGAGQHDMYLIHTDTAGDAGCNTRSGNFKRTAVTTWSEKSFGTYSSISLTSSSSILSGSKWTVKEDVECCELFVNDYKNDTLCPRVARSYYARPMLNQEYEWFKDGKSVSNHFALSVGAGEEGTYVLKVSTLVSGCPAQRDTFTLVNDKAPQIVQSDTTICQGQNLRLELAGDFVQNTWYSETSFAKLDTGIFATVNTRDSVYAISFTKKGCRHLDSINVSVVDYPVLTVRDTFAHCKGDSTLLTASSDFDYFWENDTQNVNTNIWERGNKYVRVSSINDNCVSRDSIWVAELPDPIVTQLNDTLVCGDDTLCLVSLGTGNLTYWNNSRTARDTFCTSLDTVITRAVYNQWGCVYRDTVQVKRQDTDLALFVQDTIKGQDSVQLNALLGSRFQWTGPSLSNDTIQDPWVYALGSYSVVATDGSTGCEFLDTVYVDLVTSVSGAQHTNRLAVYPIPTSGIIHLKASGTMQQIQVLNLQGKVLWSGVADSIEQQIDISELPAGTYLIEVHYTEQGRSQQLLVKK